MMDHRRDCRTCLHNAYHGVTTAWVDCVHPITFERGPRWQPGDPAMVNYRTGDLPASRLAELDECPTWEPRAALNGDDTPPDGEAA